LKVARAGSVTLKASQTANAQPVIDHSFVMGSNQNVSDRFSHADQ
jgi:hypothetical protein